jgi:hypothetical protein
MFILTWVACFWLRRDKQVVFINPAVINLNYLLSLVLFFGDGALPRNAPIQ